MPIHPPLDPARERRRERLASAVALIFVAGLVGYLVWAGIQAIANA